MYHALLTQMVEQYLKDGSVGDDSWKTLGEIFESNPPTDLTIVVQTTARHFIEVTPCSLAVACASLQQHVVDVLLKSPNAQENLFTAAVHKKYASQSYFDFLVECANVGDKKEKMKSLDILKYLHSMQMISTDACVLTASANSLPPNLLEWAFNENVGIMNYYERYKNTNQTSEAWSQIEAHAQKNLLNQAVCPYEKPSSRISKL